MNASSFYPFSIKHDRSKVKVFEAERFGWNKLTFPNVDGLKVDDEVTVDICLTLKNSLDTKATKA